MTSCISSLSLADCRHILSQYYAFCFAMVRNNTMLIVERMLRPGFLAVLQSPAEAEKTGGSLPESLIRRGGQCDVQLIRRAAKAS